MLLRVNVCSYLYLLPTGLQKYGSALATGKVLETSTKYRAVFLPDNFHRSKLQRANDALDVALFCEKENFSQRLFRMW
jgi:hypothetical protein